MKTLVDEFKNLYTELEREISDKDSSIGQHKPEGLNIDRSYLFTNEKERNFIKNCKEMRNILTHNKTQFKGKTADYFIPTEETIQILRSILDKIKNPKLVDKIYIPFKNIYSKKSEDLIFPAMEEMKKKVYTHIPILNKENVVIGVFSENTIFSYLLDQEIIEISKTMTFEDLSKYLDIDKHLSEIFKFLKKNTTITEAKKIFENELKEHKRIGMVFITERGRKDEPILGIFTPWDLVSEVGDY